MPLLTSDTLHVTCFLSRSFYNFLILDALSFRGAVPCHCVGSLSVWGHLFCNPVSCSYALIIFVFSLLFQEARLTFLTITLCALIPILLFPKQFI